jgi:chemotaxis protein CheY-P-specific phosphatase CheC
LHFTQKRCAAQQVSRSVARAYISSIATNLAAMFQENVMTTTTYSSLRPFTHHAEKMLHAVKVSANTHLQAVAEWVSSSASRHLQRSATLQHRY